MTMNDSVQSTSEAPVVETPATPTKAPAKRPARAPKQKAEAPKEAVAPSNAPTVLLEVLEALSKVSVDGITAEQYREVVTYTEAIKNNLDGLINDAEVNLNREAIFAFGGVFS